MNPIPELEIAVALQIQKPVSEVYEAIVDPAKMSQYFISESSGRLQQGKLLVWRFAEFEEDAPVRVGKIKRDHFISFFWNNGKKELLVEIVLEAMADGSTLVKIHEKGMPHDEAGISWLKGNTEGWANFLACLKAYLEYGINLRKGAFDFYRKK